MTEDDDIRRDLEPGAGDDLIALAERLRDSRPLPNPTFRGELGRRLAVRARHRGPRRIRALIAAYSFAGTLLLVIATVGAAGHGPIG
jgi:hypothetical protein